MLRELLAQSDLRIGCVVNDVAAVNIDAKLVRNQQLQSASGTLGIKDLAPTVELENGCACTNPLQRIFFIVVRRFFYDFVSGLSPVSTLLTVCNYLV